MLAGRWLSLVLSISGCCLLYAGDEKAPPDGPIVFFEDTKVRGLQCVGFNSEWSHLGVPKNALLLERKGYFVAVPLAEIEGLRLTCLSGNVRGGAPRVAEGKYRRGDKVYDLKGSTMPHVLLSGWTQSTTDGPWKFGHLTDTSTHMRPYVKKALTAPPEDAPRVVANVVLANDGKLTLRNPGFGWSYTEPGQIAVELDNVVYSKRSVKGMSDKLDTFRLDSVSRMTWSETANGRHLEFTTRMGETRRLWMRDRFITGEGDEGQLYVLLEDLKSIEFENEPKR